MKKKIKIVISPDSFKGSLSARDAAEAIAHGLRTGFGADTDFEPILLPIADGGEGTLDALVTEDARIDLTVTGTGGAPVSACYGYLGDTAVIEMARAAGLTLVPEAERNAATATTYGVGELILDALSRGYRRFLLTVGGSGTNDGGCGMFASLGARFYDADGKAFLPTGGTLDRIDHIDLSGLDRRLYDSRFVIATDVKNPLCGKDGATRVYAPQKGADQASLDRMEAGMRHYADLLQSLCGRDVAEVAGCGAGGGISAPLLAFLGGEIVSGIHAVLSALRFEEQVKDADAVITGEGKIDRQSLYGKAISGVAEIAHRHNVPVICLVGCIGDDRQALLDLGIHTLLATADIAPSPAYSIAHAAELLEKLAEELTRTRFVGRF